LFENVFFSINTVDQMNVVNYNAKGKCSLLSLHTGEHEADEGKILMPIDQRVVLIGQFAPKDNVICASVISL